MTFDILQRHNQLVRTAGQPYRVNREQLYISRGEMRPRNKVLLLACSNPIVVFEGLKAGDVEYYRNTGAIVRKDDPSLAAALTAFLEHHWSKVSKTIVICLEYPDGLNQLIIDGRITRIPELKRWTENEFEVVNEVIDDWVAGNYPNEMSELIPKKSIFSADRLEKAPENIWRGFWRDLTRRVLRNRITTLKSFPVVKASSKSITVEGWMYEGHTGRIEAVLSE